jgi:hypothetical protein
MRRTLIIFVLSTLLILSCCSEKTESEASVEVIDGVEYVHNAGTPLHPDKSVTFEEELSIGGEEYEMLSQPARFCVDQKENIYVSDYQDQAIKVFDPEGEFIRSIGRKGEGPGEFSYLGSQTFLPDGKLLAMDSMGRRLNLFDAEGTYLTSYHWTQRPGRLLDAAGSTCVMEMYVMGEGKDPLSGRKLFVKKFDFDGEEVKIFGEFQTEKGEVYTESRSGGGGIAVLISYPYSPHSIFAADQGRHYLYHCVNDEYRIEVFDGEGKVIRRIDRPYEALPFTGEDAEEFRTRYDSGRQEGLKKMVRGMAMPAVKTVTPRMLVDDRGYLWVETYEKKEMDDKDVTAYDVFNPDGYYEAKVWSDVKPEIFMNGKMYRFHTDEETGYRLVKRYRVVWSE